MAKSYLKNMTKRQKLAALKKEYKKYLNTRVMHFIPFEVEYDKIALDELKETYLCQRNKNKNLIDSVKWLRGKS